MSDTVSWILEVGINDGKLEEFKSLAREMTAATEANEPGTLAYEWFLSDDGSSCHLYERYKDSAATMIHLGTFGATYAERFMGACTPTRFVVYGDPNDEVRGVLADFGAVYMAEIAGFGR